jgi:hypothetical protein
VQSGLLASASVLELASISGNREHVLNSITQAQRLVGLDIASDFAQMHGNPRNRLDGLINNWKGIAEIRAQLPNELPDEELALALEVIEEAIANAVRKAHATIITIDIQSKQASLYIRIADNGTVEPGEPGLGTAWLDSISNGNWNRTFSDTGSELFVALPRIV